MNKIRCPFCGTFQEVIPPITLCQNCYGDLGEEIKRHSQKTVAEEEIFNLPEPPVSKHQTTQTHLREKKVDSGHSSLLTILGKTGIDFLKRFASLFPLFYLSVFSFMLIGILISRLGLSRFFPEYYPEDPSLIYLTGGGILLCLFASLYAQIAFVFVISEQHLHMSDVLVKALSRLASYIALILLMAIIIGLGYSILIFPGIIATVFLIFAPFIFVKEDVGVIAAITKSISYVAHDWLRVFLTLVPIPIVIILTLFFFAYGGTPILLKSQNEFSFVFIISVFISMSLMLMTLYVYQIYEDLRKSRGVVLPAQSAIPLSRQPEVKVPGPVFSSSQQLTPFFEMLQQAWELFQKRFFCLSVLNILSYIPHVLNLSLAVATYMSLKIFIEAFGLKGEFSILIFLALPKSVHIAVILGIILFGILYISLAIFGLVSYLHLELAFVYAIADDTITPRQALIKSRSRLHEFFQANLYRKLIASTGGLLLIPGYMFWVWYEFTPFVFAMQKEGETPLSLLAESRKLVRNLWGPVFKRMITFRFLPILVIGVLIFFILAGLPFQQMFVLFQSIFSGKPPIGMPSLHDPWIWILIITVLYVYIGLFQVPLQKVFLYLLYTELKNTKTAETESSHTPSHS